MLILYLSDSRVSPWNLVEADSLAAHLPIAQGRINIYSSDVLESNSDTDHWAW